MLEINNLKKTFENDSPALKGVDLKVNKGEFVSILGPSGSGKTTLLRTINGLETSSGGDIYFDNKKIDNNNILEVQKKTGMIFQEFNLVNNLSAINNVLTGLLNSSNKFLSLFYLFKKDQKIEALKSLKTVGLLEKSYNRSDELSGGQRQRVGIARAIIKRPLLLLADEPVASLDPKAANLILSLLKKINKEFGTTILCNLHQVDLAKKYSDRLVGLLDGKIIFDEKSENINKSNLEKYTYNMERNVIKLKVDNKDKELATYLKPQWSWKTLTTIGIFSFVLVFVVNDLEIDFIKLVTDSSKYFGDILSRMLPPDFSNLNELVYAMFETIEIAFLGTFYCYSFINSTWIIFSKKFSS